jgi:DNA-binding CsgD family transcriptional regulator
MAIDDAPTQLFTSMSPASIAPFVDDPDVCAAARDRDLRLVWCNRSYASNMGSTPEDLIGTTLFDTMTKQQAEERTRLIRGVLDTGEMHAHQQLWVGKRWLTRVWPLDPDAFGHEGYFILITPLSESGTLARGEVHFAKTGDLGPLKVLSPRELEVYYYLASGMTVSDIAETLFRSDKTIGRHVENIHKKMGYTNRAELVRDAVQRGLIHFTGRQWLELVDPRHADG